MLRFQAPKKKNQASLLGDGAQLPQNFPTEPRMTDREKGTQQCLALEHRGCANWTSGSMASVQINREAAQESPEAVGGIGEAYPNFPNTLTSTHLWRKNTQVHSHKHNST